MKLALFFLLFSFTVQASRTHRDCPPELIAHLQKSGKASETIRLVNRYLNGIPSCGKNTRPLITYYGDKANHDELRTLIKHYGWGIDLDGQIKGWNEHTLHLAASNPSPRSDEIFWLLLSTESAMDPLNRINGFTPLITIPFNGADLSLGSAAFKKIYISLAWGANPNIRGRVYDPAHRELYHNVDYANAVVRHSNNARDAQLVLDLLFERDKYFTPEFVIANFGTSFYKHALARALGNSAYVPIQPDSFCSMIYSPGHEREINTFEYLRSRNDDYSRSMLQWLEKRQISEEICTL